MRVKVFLPLPLRTLANGKKVIELEGETVGEVINNLFEKYYRLGKFIGTDGGRIKSTINIYLNGKDVRFLRDEEKIIGIEDQLKIIPTIAGGRD